MSESVMYATVKNHRDRLAQDQASLRLRSSASRISHSWLRRRMVSRRRTASAAMVSRRCRPPGGKRLSLPRRISASSSSALPRMPVSGLFSSWRRTSPKSSPAPASGPPGLSIKSFALAGRVSIGSGVRSKVRSRARGFPGSASTSVARCMRCCISYSTHLRCHGATPRGLLTNVGSAPRSRLAGRARARRRAASDVLQRRSGLPLIENSAHALGELFHAKGFGEMRQMIALEKGLGGRGDDVARDEEKIVPQIVAGTHESLIELLAVESGHAHVADDKVELAFGGAF